MGLKEFLKPEWRKFVLPAIFIIFLVISLSSFYALDAIFDDFLCDQIEIAEEFRNYAEENEGQAGSLEFNKTIEVFTERMKLNNEKPAERMKAIVGMNYILIPAWSIIAIDPFLPLPTYLYDAPKRITIIPERVIHELYISRKTYDCVKSLDGVFREMNEHEYMQVSIFTLIFNFLFLFIEGYLLSAVVLFVYRKIRHRKG